MTTSIDSPSASARSSALADRSPAISPLTGFATASAALLSACGDGQGTDSASQGADSADQAYVTSLAAPTSAKEAARFLAQATWGASKEEISALARTSYSDWIDVQFETPPLKGYYDWAAGPTGSVALSGDGDHSAVSDMWRKIIASPDALRQRVTHALAEIFVVYFTDGPGPYTYMSYLDRLERNAFGNFRDVLEAVTLSKAMGTTLTYLWNRKEDPATGRQPDENYAREIMQLFTIGLYELNQDGSLRLDAKGDPIPTYDVADVRGLARVFTGWILDGSPIPSGGLPSDKDKRDLVQQPQYHETGVKQFLDATIPAGTNGADSLKIALDVLFKHPNVGPFIGKQFIQRLVTSNPSPAYVGRVSAAFANNGTGVRGDLKAVVRAILLDPEARDTKLAASDTFGKLREPMVRFANWARGWHATSPAGWWRYAPGYSSSPTILNQGPLQSPSVFNFFRPSYVPPTTSIAEAGLVAPEFQITSEVSVAGYVNTMATFISNSNPYRDIRADYSPLLAIVTDSSALLDEINLVLAAGQLSDATLTLFKTALDTIDVSTAAGRMNRVTAALTLAMASPEYIVQK